MPSEAANTNTGDSTKREPATASDQPGQSPRFVDDCTLEEFVRPITHMSAILSELTCIKPDQRGTGTEEAITWMAVELNSRVEELRAILHREPPRWLTNMEADARRESLVEYCGGSAPEPSKPSPDFLDALAGLAKKRAPA